MIVITVIIIIFLPHPPFNLTHRERAKCIDLRLPLSRLPFHIGERLEILREMAARNPAAANTRHLNTLALNTSLSPFPSRLLNLSSFPIPLIFERVG